MPVQHIKFFILFACLVAIWSLDAVSEDPVYLVYEGEAKAVLITADNPNPVTMMAAEELAGHVLKSAGVELPIMPESQAPSDKKLSRIFIGPTQAAQDLGIRIDGLEPDAFILRAVSGDLYIVGIEDGSEFDNQSGLNGTLYGMYEVLHRFVGVRWVWPGELGTYVPQNKTIQIPPTLEETQTVKFMNRRFRVNRIKNAAEEAESGRYDNFGGMSFSAKVAQDFWNDTEVYLRRHRLGHSRERTFFGHYFAGWWQKYGEEHPDWFVMHEDGQRGFVDRENAIFPEHIRKLFVGICVTNTELQQYIIDEAWTGGDLLRLGEVDLRGFCQCPECLAWDGPQPDPSEYPRSVRMDYTPQVVSDRYARFWKTMYEMAVETNPDVTVTSFLYWNMFPAPLSDIELGDWFYGEFVPWTGDAAWYPMARRVDAWVRAQWKGWADKGIRMGYRPNLLHGGYVMPYLSTFQAGEFFQFAYEHGMEHFDFDSLFGHWAVRGPMLYMYMRLTWDHDVEIEEIRQDYFAIFGPAARHVERYFDYWEDHAHTLAEQANQAAEKAPDDAFNPHEGYTLDLFPKHISLAPTAYPSEILAHGEAILKEALETAREHANDEYARRVEFLMAGLEHARLSAAFIGTTDWGRIPDDPASFAKAREALKALIDFRREHEHLYISNMVHAAEQERAIIHEYEKLLESLK